MSLKICTAEYMISDVNGVGPRKNWFPRVVDEAFLESTKDGEIVLSPDPVTMIDGDLTWFNNTPDDQDITVLVHKAPRVVVVQSPNTVVIHDAWTHRIGVNPSADFPSVGQDCFGGKLQIDRHQAAAADLLYGRYFLEGHDSQTYVHVGTVPPQQSFHFRYLTAVQTPGIWIVPTEFEGRWEATAYWARLIALASPV